MGIAFAPVFTSLCAPSSLMDHYRSQNASPPGLLLRDTGLLILRWTAGLVLLAGHAWEESIAGWKHVWDKTPWDLAAEVADRGFPLPQAVAIAAVAVASLGSFFLFTGLLCRISALLLLICTLCGLFLYSSLPDLAEKLFLYAGIYLVIVICGPGRFSFDALLSGRCAARR